jgi:hypothetical protein
LSGGGPRADGSADQQALRVWQADEVSDDQDFIEAVSDSWGPLHFFIAMTSNMAGFPTDSSA